MKNPDIWKMKINEEVELEELGYFKTFVRRVPGGWIYTSHSGFDGFHAKATSLNMVFVPYPPQPKEEHLDI